jgi:transcriptional regulator with XRE-family HTH domain
MDMPRQTGSRRRQPTQMSDFGTELARLMAARGLGVRELARMVPCNPGHISNLRSGKARPSPELARILDVRLDADSALAALAPAPEPRRPQPTATLIDDVADEIAALDLARMAEASEVGTGTVERLELAVDELATAYPGTAPADLLGRVRGYLGYVGRLLDARITLAEHRRLLAVGGWLSLLAATTLIDLHRDHTAAAHLRTAAQLARETGHTEITAWCLETQAWQALTAGDYQSAVDISQAAQQVAPKSGSAFIQATAQEGRARARLGARQETRAVLGRVEALVSPLPVPDRPEHHYRYDPAKSEAYLATTLAWIGDPAAERYARHVLARLESASDGPPRPRRAASARLDLSLALIAAGRHDEAAGTALEAITSGRIVPSNYWRAREVIHAVAERGVPEAAQLAEAYRESCGDGERPALALRAREMVSNENYAPGSSPRVRFIPHRGLAV